MGIVGFKPVSLAGASMLIAIRIEDFEKGGKQGFGPQGSHMRAVDHWAAVERRWDQGALSDTG
jgi:hypothetical protein